MTNLQPLGENVLIESITEETSSVSGILLPESKEKPGYGKVVAVGEGRMMDNGTIVKPQIQVGDVVYFTKYSPDEIDFTENGVKKKYLIVKSSSILAKRSS